MDKRARRNTAAVTNDPTIAAIAAADDSDSAPAGKGHNARPEILARMREGRAEWETGKHEIGAGRTKLVNGICTLALALLDGKATFGKSDRKFHKWLNDSDFGDICADDRAALLNIGRHVDKARDVLAKSERTSLRHLWEEVREQVGLAGYAKPKGKGTKTAKQQRKSSNSKKSEQELSPDVKFDGVMARLSDLLAHDTHMLELTFESLAREFGATAEWRHLVLEEAEKLNGFVPAANATADDEGHTKRRRHA